MVLMTHRTHAGGHLRSVHNSRMSVRVSALFYASARFVGVDGALNSLRQGARRCGGTHAGLRAHFCYVSKTRCIVLPEAVKSTINAYEAWVNTNERGYTNGHT